MMFYDGNDVYALHVELYKMYHVLTMGVSRYGVIDLLSWSAFEVSIISDHFKSPDNPPLSPSN
jgi:hypothetical protein